jgi:hypothetical protein
VTDGRNVRPDSTSSCSAARHPSASDWLADATGGIAGALNLTARPSRPSRRSRRPRSAPTSPWSKRRCSTPSPAPWTSASTARSPRATPCPRRRPPQRVRTSRSRAAAGLPGLGYFRFSRTVPCYARDRAASVFALPRRRGLLSRPVYFRDCQCKRTYVTNSAGAESLACTTKSGRALTCAVTSRCRWFLCPR